MQWNPFKSEDKAVTLDFWATDLEAECQYGVYYVTRFGHEWAVKFRPRAAGPEARALSVDALTADGESIDWPTRRSAERACMLHAKLMVLGYSPERAATLVADRARRPLSATARGLNPVVAP